MSRVPGDHDAGRRLLMQGAAAGLALGVLPGASSASRTPVMADLVVRNARITTLDPRRPSATALAVSAGRIVAVGDDAQIMAMAEGARIIDAQGRRLLPGLNDSHTHLIRGGLNYNLELRWDGVRSLADAMAMLKAQVDRTPAPQWVRVVGGFTSHQFVEKRLPTLEEINAIAPDTPVFLLHLYDRALLNRAALRACGYDKNTQDPPGGHIERDKLGNPTGLLLAKPNALILYASLAKGPRLPVEYQANSTRHFMRELNRLGITSVIDAGGGFQNYPEDYQVIEQLHAAGQLSVRIAYNLFTQNKDKEVQDFRGWTELLPVRKGDDLLRHNGAGEMLVFSAADFELFSEPRPELPPELEPELEQVVRLLVEKRWPFRIHATYDESIERILDVYEKVNADIPFDGLHWFIDHAETITPRNIDRIRALNGGIAVQHRMAYQGEAFVERYGVQAARQTPPVRRMLAAGVPVGAGTDATRVGQLQPVGGAVVAGDRAHRRRACAVRRGKLARSRAGAAPVDPGQCLVLRRRVHQGHPGGRAAGGLHRVVGRLFSCRRRCHCRHHQCAHRLGRTGGAWRWRLRGAGTALAARDAGLVTGQPVWWLPRGRRSQCTGRRRARAWPRLPGARALPTCGPACSTQRRPARFLGRIGLLMLRVLTPASRPRAGSCVWPHYAIRPASSPGALLQ